MTEPRSAVGISNREAPEEEARARREHPAQLDNEADPAQDELLTPDGQSSTKTGTKSSAQKSASTRHTENTAPATAKVQGAFGKEAESED